MEIKRRTFSVILILSILLNLTLVPFTSVAYAMAAALPLVDDFEAGLPSGKDANNVSVGFNTFQDPNSTVAISLTTTPPVAVPGAGAPNNVLKLDLSVVSWAGFTHSFENAAVNTWITQDWSAYAGISFWLYGNNSGTNLFVDVLDNRNPGSIKDDAERWSITVPDNFSGWQKIQIPFADLRRKEIGNSAPNDGLGLDAVNGWALGSVTTPAAQTYYVDNVELYGVAPVKPLTVGFSTINYNVTEGNLATVTAKLSKAGTDPVMVQYKTTIGTAIINRDYAPVAGLLTFPAGIKEQTFSVPTYNNLKYEGERSVVVELYNPSPMLALGTPPVARVNIQDNELHSPNMLGDFESTPYLWSGDSNITLTNPEIMIGSAMALPGQGAYEHILQVGQKNGAAGVFGSTFPIAQNWSDRDGLKFWYYGQNSGQNIQLSLTNTTPIVYQHVFMPVVASNRAASANVALDPAPVSNQASTDRPSDWALVWSDEFNSPSGTGANPNVWDTLVGDGTAYGIPGWGNDELEYYTAGTANAATNGQGQLQIVTDKADGSLMCYYGPCQYTSTRMQTRNRFEVAYGRVEARVKVPQGAGLWPAFWMLGTNIDQAPWPQSGEIDIMEVVGRLPNQVFGTLHGPGYSGGASYGKILDLGKPVADDYHVFAVEWQPNKIIWYLDGAPYFTATPDDAFLQGKQWVFNHPFYLLLNTAVGGNFGGAVGTETTFPQTTSVDYVRVYQAKTHSTAFQASFLDNFSGWQEITIPFTAFQGSGGQNPNLAAIQSLSFAMPAGMVSPMRLDQVALIGGKTQMDLPVTFDSPSVDYGLIGFGGADDSTIVSDPAGGANQVAKVIKSATAELWAGTTITAPAALGFANKIPFSATRTKMTVRTYSPDAGIHVRLKVEDHTNGGISVETEATTTVANAWETLTFNFANHVAGTSALNLANNYDKASIFFNFGVTGATAGAKTYYFDDVAFPKTQMDLPVTFDSPDVAYGLIGFGGADDSSVVTDPSGGPNQVAKVIKSATAELWAGTTITAPAALGFANKIPFTATATQITVRTYSPDAGIHVRLKVEDHTNGGISVETEATTTVANAWETLTFNFANHVAGTPALNLANNYDKASIFFNFGVTGAIAGAKTYYFDDVAFAAPAKTQMDLPVTFDSATVDYGLIGFGGADDSTIVADPTNAGNQVAKVVKSATAETWAGTTITAPAELGFANKVPFTATAKRMTVRVYSPDAGIQVRLKVEDHTNNTITVETEATTTVANAWETLTFDFANQANGTAALNLANNYDKASIFFNFGVSGATTGSAKTYYFDDVAFASAAAKTQMDLPVTFDSATVDYGLIGFGGADDSTIVADPTNAGNQVAKVIKSATAETWAGTTITAPAELGFANKVPFTATAKQMTVRVYSPDAGIQVRLKLEDHANNTITVETEATTTVANAWETLTFDFANPAGGTAALNLANNYDKASIFFNFGVSGATTGSAKTYYFDDVAFVAPPAKTQMDLPVTFDSATVDYGLIGFGGADDSTIVSDPAGGTNQVAKVIKSATAQTWAGTTITAPAQLGFANKVPFTATAKRMTVRVYSPDAGIQVRLKVEDHANNTITVETEATTTVANGWETLTFDFANPANGTAALNLANTYDKASIFFNFGVSGATVGSAKTYYFDDVAFLP